VSIPSGPQNAENSRGYQKEYAVKFDRQLLQFAGAISVAAVLVMGMPCAAQSVRESGPFSALLGRWSGSGVIMKSDGTSERIRCSSAYEPVATASLQLRLRCASDSYNFDLASTVTYDGGPISGDWSETTRNANGTIQGRSDYNGRQVQVVAQSVAFTANLSLTTRGKRQSVLILAPGTEVPKVNITLERR
jgi:hypothetical protein